MVPIAKGVINNVSNQKAARAPSIDLAIARQVANLA
jgi:hypothetical protein